MPYILQTYRALIDSLINECPKGWESCYWLVKKAICPSSYRLYAQCIAVFECAHMEYYRRTQHDAGFPESVTDAGECPPAIQTLATYIDIHHPHPDGVLNYCCTLLAESPLDLVRAKEFMYANDIGPYEDTAIAKNGDIPCYAAHSATKG